MDGRGRQHLCFLLLLTKKKEPCHGQPFFCVCHIYIGCFNVNAIFLYGFNELIRVIKIHHLLYVAVYLYRCGAIHNFLLPVE